MGEDEIMKTQDEKQIKKHYLGVIGCCKEECALHGALTWINTKYYFPRWFYGDYTSHKDVLVVATNPGWLGKNNRDFKQIIDSWRVKKFDETERNEHLFEEQIKLVKKYFDASVDSFHEPLSEALGEILGITRGELFSKINFTNIVKCSTCCNFGVFFKDFKQTLLKLCVQTHFKQEIKLLQPKIIILYVDKNSREMILDALVRTGVDAANVIHLPRAPRIKKKRDIWMEKVRELNIKYENMNRTI